MNTSKHRQMGTFGLYLLGETPKTPYENMKERNLMMLKRNIEIKVRLNRDEANTLTKRAKKCGFSREAYIRSLLNGNTPREIPPPAYHDMTRELHGIGNNLNQIAQKAHILNVMDVGRYDEALRRFSEVVAKIEEAVILPMKAK